MKNFKLLLIGSLFVAGLNTTGFCNNQSDGNITGKYISEKNGTGHFEITFIGDMQIGGEEIDAGIADQTVNSGTYIIKINGSGESRNISLIGKSKNIQVDAVVESLRNNQKNNIIEITDSARGKQMVSIFQDGLKISFFIY